LKCDRAFLDFRFIYTDVLISSFTISQYRDISDKIGNFTPLFAAAISSYDSMVKFLVEFCPYFYFNKEEWEESPHRLYSLKDFSLRDVSKEQLSLLIEELEMNGAACFSG
jgi:hypothetical protein